MLNRSIDPASGGRRPAMGDDAGWVMIPVVVLLVVALGLGFALLSLVDTQTQAASKQRDIDAAHTLAEGVATSTANVLAAGVAADWSTTNCSTGGVISGKLTTDPNAALTNPASSLAGRIETEVRTRFKKDVTLSAYGKAERAASWTIRLCPTTDAGVTATDNRFTSATLERSGSTGTVNGHKTLWIRAQTRILTAQDADVRRSAVAAKVVQGGSDFVPSSDVAIATGKMSLGLSSALGSLLNGGTLGNAVLGTVLGTKPEVDDFPTRIPANAKIGTRCDLLNGLSNTTNLQPNALNLDLCLSGAVAGTGQLVSSLGLGTLNSVLGTNRFTTLAGWSSTTPRAIQAYRDLAVDQQNAGIGPGVLNPGGYGDITTRNTAGANVPCVTDTQWNTMPAVATGQYSQSVVFIDKVGNGDNYCTLSGDHQARIFVVARGGVRVTGKFKGVVYGLNLGECDTSSRTSSDINDCSVAERKNAASHEAVRIEAGGQVQGAVWVDGAKGQLGIIPPDLSGGSTVTNALLNTATSTLDDRICSLPASIPLITPLTNLVTNLVGSVLGLVGGLVNEVAGIRNEAQSLPAGSATPVGDPPADAAAGCGIFKAALKGLSSTDVASRLGLGGSVPVGMEGWTRRQTKGCGFLGLSWCEWGPWTKTSKTSSTSVLVPGDQTLLNGILGIGGTLTDVVSALTSTLSTSTAVYRDPLVIGAAMIGLKDNATFVPGSFRSVPVIVGT
ncbi:MAG: hypothetical protein JWO31_3843 [Phycisphaerales bacterium]|nr:hypothetical protein [Phycisphaerales bacterium]